MKAYLDNAAMRGAETGRKHIVSTAIEHHAVLHMLAALKKDGFEVTLLPVEAGTGLVSPAALEAALRDDTALVTVMAANNEIGIVQPVETIGELTDRAVAEALDGLPSVKMHCSVLAEQAVRMAIKDYYDRSGVAYDPGLFAGLGDGAHGHGGLAALDGFLLTKLFRELYNISC